MSEQATTRRQWSAYIWRAYVGACICQVQGGNPTLCTTWWGSVGPLCFWLWQPCAIAAWPGTRSCYGRTHRWSRLQRARRYSKLPRADAQLPDVTLNKQQIRFCHVSELGLQVRVAVRCDLTSLLKLLEARFCMHVFEQFVEQGRRNAFEDCRPGRIDFRHMTYEERAWGESSRLRLSIQAQTHGLAGWRKTRKLQLHVWVARSKSGRTFYGRIERSFVGHCERWYAWWRQCLVRPDRG